LTLCSRHWLAYERRTPGLSVAALSRATLIPEGEIVLSLTTENSAPLQKLLSARETAVLLNVCEKTLWSMTAPRGQIAVVRIGRRILYDPRDLNRWIESNKSAAGKCPSAA
jgi:hypothetical protein